MTKAAAWTTRADAAPAARAEPLGVGHVAVRGLDSGALEPAGEAGVDVEPDHIGAAGDESTATAPPMNPPAPVTASGSSLE